MTPAALHHIGFLILEASIVCVFLLTCFRLRTRFGLSLLYVTLGAFQHLQTQLAASFYVEVWPDIFVSPGSAVLFTATLFATLLVYIRDDAAGARQLIAGIVAANVTLTVVMFVMQQHISGATELTAVAAGMLSYVENIKPLIVGTMMLFIDVIVIIILYEFFYRLFPRSLSVRVTLAMTCVVILDTMVFMTINFYGHAQLFQTLLAGLAGKVFFAVFYSLAMVLYLRTVAAPEAESGRAPEAIRDIFHILTYRQRYELLKDEISRDAMSGLFNRGFFDENLVNELKRAARLQHGLKLILVDLDNFKKINDDYGHQVGDQIIMILADAMRESFREADIPCRYGGEEFAVILPDCSGNAAIDVANRLRRKLREKCMAANLPIPSNFVTFTAGIASYPEDAVNAQALIKVADMRLYEGKRGGRDRVVIESGAAIAAGT